MAKVLLKNSTAKPLSPLIRQRLTFQSALLTNPQKYIKNVKFDVKKQVKEIPERECPPKPLVSEKTQTRDVLDAETNTKSRFSTLESKKSKLKTKCSSWAKEARNVSRCSYMEIARRMRGEWNVSQKKTTWARAADSKKDLPEIKRRRGILKKVLEEVAIEGMCSQGTATEGNKPTLERILKENHLFLKYSRNCKAKKKRVRMEKQPAFFSKRPEESVQSLEASEDERPKKVRLSDDEDSADLSEESLERKPARLALLSPSSDTDRRLSVHVCHMASAPQLIASEKQLHLLRPRQILQQEDSDGMTEYSHDSPKRPPCRVPRDQLYFKNMFAYLPGMYRR